MVAGSSGGVPASPRMPSVPNSFAMPGSTRVSASPAAASRTAVGAIERTTNRGDDSARTGLSRAAVPAST